MATSVTTIAPRRRIGRPADLGSVVRMMQASVVLAIVPYERSVADRAGTQVCVATAGGDYTL